MRNTQAKMSPVQTNPCYKMCFGTSLQWYELEVVQVDDGTSLQILVRVDSGTS
jgi:hypothetical protein